jgi:hypothetical protein
MQPPVPSAHRESAPGPAARREGPGTDETTAASMVVFEQLLVADREQRAAQRANTES